MRFLTNTIWVLAVTALTAAGVLVGVNTFGVPDALEAAVVSAAAESGALSCPATGCTAASCHATSGSSAGGLGRGHGGFRGGHRGQAPDPGSEYDPASDSEV